MLFEVIIQRRVKQKNVNTTSSAEIGYDTYFDKANGVGWRSKRFTQVLFLTFLPTAFISRNKVRAFSQKTPVFDSSVKHSSILVPSVDRWLDVFMPTHTI